MLTITGMDTRRRVGEAKIVQAQKHKLDQNASVQTSQKASALKN